MFLFEDVLPQERKWKWSAFFLISRRIYLEAHLYYPCRNLPLQPVIFRGHSDGISSFSIWGHDVISISRSRIGLLSLSKSANETV